MSLEPQLREKFQTYANGAPASAGLLDAVRRRSRRRRWRRRAGVSGLALILVASGAAASPLLWRALDGGPSQASSPTVNLVPPTDEIPPFPVTPQWTPAGLGEPSVGFSETGMWLQYDRSSLIYVDVTRNGSILKPSVTGLSQALPDGRMLTVAGTAPVEDLERFLNGLVPTPIPVPAPFTFDLMPDGVEPVVVQGTTTGLLPPIMQFQSPDRRINVLVHLMSREESTYLDTGIFEVAGDNTVLYASIDVDGVPVADEILTRFVDGIHLTDHAVVLS